MYKVKENNKLVSSDGKQVIVPSEKKHGFYEVRSFLPNGDKMVGIATKEELEKHFLMNFKQYNHVNREEKEEQATYQFLNQKGDYHKSGVCNIQITLSKEDTGLDHSNSLDFSLMHAKVQSKLHRRGIIVRDIVLGVSVGAIMAAGLTLAVRQGLKTRFGDEFFDKPSSSLHVSEKSEEKPQKEELSEEEIIRRQIYEDIMNQMEEENNINYNK